MKTTKFYSSGLVYGQYWGGGEGAYEARQFTGDTKESIIEKVKAALADGSLDSGMGYQKLLGALIDIEEVTTIEVDGKKFTNREYHSEFIGDLNEEQQDFLIGIRNF